MNVYPLHHPAYCIRTWSIIVLAWLLAVVALSASGLLATGNGFWRLSMPAMIVLPIAVFTIVYRGNSTFRARVLSIDTGILVILHSWRMVGTGFLFLYAYNVLPAMFAWIAGIGDMLAAFSAVLIGSALLKGSPVARKTLLLWNSFGLFDFVIAIIIGTLLRSVYLGGEISTDAMAQLPLSLVPTVVVPLYIITHLVIFLQVKNGTYQARPATTACVVNQDSTAGCQPS